MKKFMKKKTVQKLLILFAVFGLLCSAVTVQAAAPAISKKTATVYVGKSVTLKMKNSKGEVKWKSSDSKVAAVNKAGKVTGKKAGSAKITATVNKKSYTCKVTVKEARITKMSLKSSKSVNVNETIQVKVSVKPSNLKKSFIWKSSNTKIATVSSKGVVKGISAGTVKITVTTNDKWKDSLSVYITVKKSQQSNIRLKGMEASCKLSEVESGYQLKNSDFTVKGIYSDGSRKNIGYSFEYVYSGGYCKVTITASGYSKTISIPVKKSAEATVTGVSYFLDPAYVYVGENLKAGQLQVIARYSDGSQKEVTDYTTTFVPQSAAGTCSFDVIWNDMKKTLSISVKEKETETAEPTLQTLNAEFNRKFIYSDETPTTSDIVVTGTYSDGSTKTITDYTYDFIPASGHKQMATAVIHYAGQNLDISVMSIVKTEPKQVDFQFVKEAIGVGEEINRNNITVTATDYAGNVTYPTDFSVDYEPKSEAGTYSFTVSYKGFSYTFDVTVTADE